MIKRFMLVITLLMFIQTGCQTQDMPGIEGDTTTNTKDEYINEKTIEEPVEFSVVFLKNDWHNDPWEMGILQTIEEKANVVIDWKVYNKATWGNQKDLLIASGDIPDVFYMQGVLDFADVAKLSNEGMLIDLTELIEKHAPRLSQFMDENPEYKELNTDSTTGKIYSLGFSNGREVGLTQAMHYINKEWLDKLGYDIPTSVDEYYEVMKAFKEMDANGNGDTDDEIPFSCFGNPNITYDIGFNYGDLFGAFGYTDNLGDIGGIRHIGKTEKGEIIFVPITEEYKNAIAFYSKFVREGLWDIESFSMTDKAPLINKGNSVTPILGSFMAFEKNFVIPKKQMDNYVLLKPLEGPDGYQMWTKDMAGIAGGGTYFSITNRAKGKEVAIIKWLDEHFDIDNSIQLFLGTEGVVLEKNDEGFYQYIETPEEMTYSEFRYGNAPVHVPLGIVADDWGTIVEVMEEDAIKVPQAKEYYLPYSTFSTIFVKPTAEETEYLLNEGKLLINYINKMQIRWLKNGKIEEEWETYIEVLDELNVNSYIDLVKKMDRRNK